LVPLIEHLAGYCTITLEEFSGKAEFQKEYFFIFGFPFRGAKYDRADKELTAKPLKYFTIPVTDPSVYKKYDCSQEIHMIVQYDPKATKNQDGIQQKAPLPHGISGGPLFRALINEQDEIEMLILEGMLTTWKDSKFVIATRKTTIKKFIESVLR